MTPEITIDPRDFIGPAFHDCPNCGKHELGLLMVGGDRVTRRCRECWHTESARLPPLNRKIIYLDQMVVSNIEKALNPGWKREVNPFWSDLFSKLDRLLKLQLILCPFTTGHQEESSVTPSFTKLRRIYEHLGNGTYFGFPDEIHSLQLRFAFGAYLEGQSFDHSSIDRSYFIHGNLDLWMDRLRISMPHMPTPEEIESFERRRDEAHAGLSETVARWAREKGRSFDEWLSEELVAYHEISLLKYLEHKQAVVRYMSGQGPLSDLVWNPSLLANIPSPLIEEAIRRGDSFPEAFARVQEFLLCDQGLTVPRNYITAHLLAALARKVAAGQRKVSRGTFNDVISIATVAPYSDLLFVDDQFAGMLREEPLLSRLGLAEKTFSNRTRDEFLAHIVKIEQSAPDGHLESVRAVYGDSWLTPYKTMLEEK